MSVTEMLAGWIAALGSDQDPIWYIYVHQKNLEELSKMKKKIVFISQPMNGLSDEDILAAREEAIQDIKNQLGDDIEIADSYFKEEFEVSPEANRGLFFLAASLKMLAQSTHAYFCDGWEAARGCNIEHLCAEEYGIPIVRD